MGSYHKASWQVKYARQLVNISKFIDSLFCLYLGWRLCEN